MRWPSNRTKKNGGKNEFYYYTCCLADSAEWGAPRQLRRGVCYPIVYDRAIRLPFEAARRALVSFNDDRMTIFNSYGLIERMRMVRNVIGYVASMDDDDACWFHTLFTQEFNASPGMIRRPTTPKHVPSADMIH